MLIERVLNNNVVVVLNEQGDERIVMGKGIAFQKKPHDEVDTAKIEKIFVPENQPQSDEMKALFRDVAPQDLEAIKMVVDHSENQMGRKLENDLYFLYFDHLAHALKRAKEGIFIPNPLVFDIQRFYPKEFATALEALTLIEEQTGIVFPEGEAGFIALHLASNGMGSNGMGPGSIHAVMDQTMIVRDILSMISKYYGVILDDSSLAYQRMVTHLQYFVQRILADGPFQEQDEFLFALVQSKYPKAFRCGERIVDYLKTTRKVAVQESELIYLVIHIHRVLEAQSE